MKDRLVRYKDIFLVIQISTILLVVQIISFSIIGSLIILAGYTIIGIGVILFTLIILPIAFIVTYEDGYDNADHYHYEKNMEQTRKLLSKESFDEMTLMLGKIRKSSIPIRKDKPERRVRRNRVRELYLDGVPIERIAEILDSTVPTINRDITKLGLRNRST
jgi:ABC-type transport system involved in multi-copper enzyme maturation permease subunit